MRRVRALVAGVALAALVAAPVAAYDVSESLVVNGTLTVTGLPATVNYGALDMGTRSGEQTVAYQVAANGNFTIQISGTDFARSGGGASIPKGAREGWITTPSSGASCTPTEMWADFSTGGQFDDAATECTGTMGTAKDYTLKLRVNVPTGQMAGTYTGTVAVVIAIP